MAQIGVGAHSRNPLYQFWCRVHLNRLNCTNPLSPQHFSVVLRTDCTHRLHMRTQRCVQKTAVAPAGPSCTAARQTVQRITHVAPATGCRRQPRPSRIARPGPGRAGRGYGNQKSAAACARRSLRDSSRGALCRRRSAATCKRSSPCRPTSRSGEPCACATINAKAPRTATGDLGPSSLASAFVGKRKAAGPIPVRTPSPVFTHLNPICAAAHNLKKCCNNAMRRDLPSSDVRMTT